MAVTLGLAGGMVWSAGAQSPDASPTAFFDDAPQGLANRPNFAAKRSRTVDPDLDQLSGDSLYLNLFDDVSVLARRDHLESGLNDSTIWTGHLSGVTDSQVILVERDGTLSGTIKWSGNIYAVRPLGNGQHAVEQIDPLSLPPLAQPLLRPGLGPPVPEEQADVGGTGEESQATSESIAGDQTIDVMVVYTEASRAEYNPLDGGAEGIETMIRAAITEANLAYARSNVDVTLNLVHMEKLDYDETSGGIVQSLNDLTGTTDGFMDGVHGLRDEHQADMVSLITEDNDYCGVAWLMQELDFDFESAAFSVVYSTCLTHHTLAHEFGHTMGSTHDRPNANGPGVYPYSYGHNSIQDGWYTVMSYSCGPTCARIGHFSNPDVFIVTGGNSRPSGIDHDADPDNSADNARSLNNAAFTVARFREAPPSGTPEDPTNVQASAVSFNQVDVSWDYGGINQWTFEIERNDVTGTTWEPVAIVAGNFASYSDTTAYPETTYVYRVRAAHPNDVSNWVTSLPTTTGEAPPYSDDVAIGETPIFGNVGGDYTDTASADGVSQTIGEKVTGGKPANRTSRADHEWIFEVTGGNSVTLFLMAAATPSSDDDVFHFYYSTDRNNYYRVLTVDGDTDGSVYQSVSLPSTLVGTLYIRVVDWDRMPGNTALDSLTVDHMFIRSEMAFGPPPAAPSGLEAVAMSSDRIDLSWVDESENEYGFYIYRSRDGDPLTAIATTAADATSYTDEGLSSSTEYTYEVRAFNAVDQSDPSNPASATTEDGIDLWFWRVYTIKGKKKADLRWAGATSGTVDIFRDDGNGFVLITNTANDGSYLNTIGKIGGDVFLYKVCEPVTNGLCSNIAVAQF